MIIKPPHIVPSHKHGMQIAMEFSGETSLKRGHTWRLMRITSMLGDQSTPHLVGILIRIKVRQSGNNNIRVNNLRPKRGCIWRSTHGLHFVCTSHHVTHGLYPSPWLQQILPVKEGPGSRGPSVPTCKCGLTHFSRRVPRWCWWPHMKQGWHYLQLNQIWCNDTTKSAEVINGSTHAKI